MDMGLRRPQVAAGRLLLQRSEPLRPSYPLTHCKSFACSARHIQQSMGMVQEVNSAYLLALERTHSTVQHLIICGIVSSMLTIGSMTIMENPRRRLGRMILA